MQNHRYFNRDNQIIIHIEAGSVDDNDDHMRVIARSLRALHVSFDALTMQGDDCIIIQRCATITLTHSHM